MSNTFAHKRILDYVSLITTLATPYIQFVGSSDSEKVQVNSKLTHWFTHSCSPCSSTCSSFGSERLAFGWRTTNLSGNLTRMAPSHKFAGLFFREVRPNAIQAQKSRKSAGEKFRDFYMRTSRKATFEARLHQLLKTTYCWTWPDRVSTISLKTLEFLLSSTTWWLHSLMTSSSKYLNCWTA